jgi:CelD/BcsL family acetyltransferase involved in cellulose biosynthesis
MNYDIKVFFDLNNELKNYWNNLEKESDNFCFQSYEWFENWSNSFRNSSEKYSLCIVKVSTQSKTLCIMPFEIEKIVNLKVLKWAGGKQSDYMAPILSKNFNLDKNDFIKLWKKILKTIPKIDLVYLSQQPEFVDKIKNPFSTYLKNYKNSITHNILLPNSWHEYTSLFLKKNFYLQNIRKKKHLKKQGKVKFKIIKKESEKINYIEELVKQKNKRLSSQGIKAAFKLEDLNFYKNFEKKELKKIKTHISALYLNSEIIALHWGVIYKDRFYYLLLSMKEENLKKYSPGRLLISLLIRWSISKKIKIFDFTLGDENYKKSWANKSDVLFDSIQLISLRGFFLFILLNIKLILKPIYKKIF